MAGSGPAMVMSEKLALLRVPAAIEGASRAEMARSLLASLVGRQLS
jgi:hypothetical protein